jgi:hypothetical protein
MPGNTQPRRLLALINEQPIAPLQDQSDFGVTIYPDLADHSAIWASQVPYRFVLWNRIEQIMSQFRVSSRFLPNLGDCVPNTERERN